MLFKQQEHLIDPYIRSLEAPTNQGSSLAEKRDLCAKMLKAIVADPEKYDKLTPLNSGWWHNDFVEIIVNRKFDPESIAELLKILSRIAREATLRQPYVPKPPESDLLTYFEFGKEGLNEEEKLNSDFIWASMPKYIAMEQHGEIALKQTDVNNAIAKWNKELSEIEAKVAKHEENLKNITRNITLSVFQKLFMKCFRKKGAKKIRYSFYL